jgi:NNP family nitrate/nitrite transporter-like MFS transporter
VWSSKWLNSVHIGWLAVLIVSTLAFTVCFMVWMMFGVIGIPIKKTLGLNATEFGLLTAVPVLTGSLIRVPLGIWTDKFGGRIVLFILMASPCRIWLMSYATEYWHFLTIGLFVGLAGGSFSVGTPYVARWFPRAARAWPWASTAPATRAPRSTSSSRRCCWWPLAGPWCRRSMPPSCWARLILFWMFSYSDPAHLVPSTRSSPATSSRR